MHIPPHDVRLVCINCRKHLDAIRTHRFFADEDLRFLENARRGLVVHFPITMDDGSVRIVEGYRVQYNDALGPTKGGIRMHHEADFDEVSELAFLMSLKTSLVGLPYGGAKGAIRINPKELSKAEHERVVRGFVRQIAHFIGPERDIPAPDVNTNAETMALMLNEYETIVGHKAKAAFTGKPFALGGSLGRETSTARGGFYILQEHFKNKNLGELRVAVQGFGNVGGHLAELLDDAGFSVVAVSDSRGGLYNNSGLPLQDLLRWKADRKSFADFTPTPGEAPPQKISNEDLLLLDVDVLVPAALGNVITPTNARSVKAQTIVEMANAPISPDADPILKEVGVTVIPDILANSGGVIVSYFEWLQNREGAQWTAEKVDHKLKGTTLRAYRRVIDEYTKRPQFDMRTVSYLLAIERILEAEKEGKEK